MNTLEWLTPDITEEWWEAIALTITALSGSTWLARKWWIARKAAQLALLVVQILGRNYVDRWKAENSNGKLTVDQVDWAKNEATKNLDALVEKESPAIQAYVEKVTPEVLVESAVIKRKVLREKRDKKVKVVRKIGPKGGIR